MPGTLSSITRHRSGGAGHLFGREQKQVGRRLAVATCTAEKICGANRSYSPAPPRLARIFSGVPLDATHFGSAIAASASIDVGHRLQRGGERAGITRPAFARRNPRAVCGPFRLRLRGGLPRRAAEKAVEHLIGGDRVAVTRQDLGMGAAGNHLAVDQHAVAIENDEIELFDAFSSRERCHSLESAMLRICRRPAGRNTVPAGDRPVCSRACGRFRPAASRSPRR